MPVKDDTLEMIIKKPWRAFCRSQDFARADYDTASDLAKKDIDRAHEQWLQLAKSLYLNEDADILFRKDYNTESKLKLHRDLNRSSRISTIMIEDMISNCSTKGLADFSKPDEVFDVTHNAAISYFILWQVSKAHVKDKYSFKLANNQGIDFGKLQSKQAPLKLAEFFAKQSVGFLQEPQNVEEVFQKKWVYPEQFIFGPQGNITKEVITYVMLPVLRAPDVMQGVRQFDALAMGDDEITLDGTNAVHKGSKWRMNRTEAERAAYGMSVQAPLWLNYQALVRDDVDYIGNPKGIHAFYKGHMFKYNLPSAGQEPVATVVVDSREADCSSNNSDIKMYEKAVYAPKAPQANKMAPQKHIQHWNRKNFRSVQTFQHPVAYYHALTAWADKGKGENKIGPNAFAAWGSTRTDQTGANQRKIKGLGSYVKNDFQSAQHGSVAGWTRWPAGYDNDPNKYYIENGFKDGTLWEGILQGPKAASGFLRLLKTFYNIDPKASLPGGDVDAVRFDDAVAFFQGRDSKSKFSKKPTGEVEFFNKSSDKHKLMKAAMLDILFNFKRQTEWGKSGDNRGGLRFALEPIRSFKIATNKINQKGKGSNQSPPASQAFLSLFSWYINLLSPHGNKKIVSLIQPSDLFGATGKDDDYNVGIFKWLVASMHSLIEEIAKLRKKDLDGETPPEDAVGEGDTFSSSAKRQIITNAQCFMLNTVNRYAENHMKFSLDFPKTYDSICITNNGRPDGSGVTCEHFMNLIGKKDEVLDKLLNIKPSELALLQPRIRLYKQRKVLEKGKLVDTFKKVEVPGPFETNINGNAFEKIISQNRGRAFGSGIKEVNVKVEGGNQVFNVASMTEVDITFYFNRLDEIFINWPRYSFGKDGKIDFTKKPSYPFGTTPGFETDPPASIAELVFPTAVNPNTITPESFVNFDRPGFQIMLEFGWSMPQGSNIFKQKGYTDLLEQLRKKILYKTFFLTPTKSDFDMKENGSVELKITYYALSENLLFDKKNKLFPQLHMNSFGPELQRKIDTLREKIKEAKKNNKLKSKNTKSVKEMEEELKKLIQSGRDTKFSEFLTKGIQGLFNTYMGFDPNSKPVLGKKDLPTNQIYHRMFIPKTFLNIYEKEKKVSRWKPYSELGRFQNFKFERSQVQTQGRLIKPDGTRTSTGSSFRDASLASAQAAGALSLSSQKLDQKNRKEAIKYKSLALKKIEEGTVGAYEIPENSRTIPIDFIYFGDMVQATINYVKSQYPTNSSKFKQELDKINFVFGCINVPIIMGSEVKVMPIKITDIPIVTQVLTEFIVNNIIKTENYNISYPEFIIEFYRWFLREYFSKSCFIGVKEILAMSPEIQFFDMYGKKHKGVKPFHPLVKSATKTKGICFTRKQFQNEMDLYDARQKTNSGKIDKVHSFHYCYLGAQTLGQGAFDYAKDLENNIHHFYIGRDVGIVKRIEFKSSELQGRAEAVWSVVGDELDDAMFMIPKVYDVTVTLVGNHLFEPGQTFFVDPTLGTTLSTGPKKLTGLNVLKNSGLGGYYYINKIESRIKTGGYETIIEGIKIGLSNSPHAGVTVDPISSSEAQISSLQDQMDEAKKKQMAQNQKGIGDILIDWALKQ